MPSNYNEYAGLPPLDGQRDGDQPAGVSSGDPRAPSVRPWPPVPPGNGYVPGGESWPAGATGDPGFRGGWDGGQYSNETQHTSSWAAVSASVESTLPPGGSPTSRSGHGGASVATLEEVGGDEDLIGFCKVEYDRISRELDELRILLTQSGKEMDKLQQRKVLAAAQVREMEEHLEHHPRQAIRETYLAAAEAEMRAFMIGEQREQMQAKVQTYERYGVVLRRTIEALEAAFAGGAVHMGAGTEATLWPVLPDMPTTALVNPAASSVLSLSAVLPAVQGPLDAVLRIIQAQENMRERVAQRLHDGPTQSLANVVLTAEICEKLVQSDPRRALAELGNLKGLVNATLQETRKFIFELRPMTLNDLGLVPTLRRYTADLAARHQVDMPLTAPQGERRLPKEAEIAVFRVAQEALLNAVAHSSATVVQVTLAWLPDGFVLAVQDNGTGFNVEQALARAVNRQTIGIAGMQERAEMLGGWLKIESSPGRGTRIELSVPDAEAQASKTFGVMQRY